MAATVSGFTGAFPDFTGRDATELATRLAAVELRVSADWGDMRDEVVYLELASSLAGTVAGRRGRTVDESNGRNVYDAKLKELKATFALTRRISA